MDGRRDGARSEQARLARTKYEYHVPTNVKKIDIGGGLIHGAALDFKDDPSERIILALPTGNIRRKKKSARCAVRYGRRSHQGISKLCVAVCFRVFANLFRQRQSRSAAAAAEQSGATYNPEAIIVQEGVRTIVHLILTGNVEWLTSETQLSGMLSAGAFIGERSVLTERPASITVRAASRECAPYSSQALCGLREEQRFL